MPVKAVLVGNPNCGKSTLFNVLTGGNAHVGNWPGVTVERRQGKYKIKNEEISLIDLPGIYSLSPYSPEEDIARQHIVGSDTPDVIINIVDATAIERSLYLTTELMETDIPIVIAINMMDAAKKHGISISTEKLSKKLGVEVIAISAVKGRGINELMKAVLRAARLNRIGVSTLYEYNLNKYVKSISQLLKSEGVKHPAYYAAKILEEGMAACSNINLDSTSDLRIKSAYAAAKRYAPDGDIETAAAIARYNYIDECCETSVKKLKIYNMTASDKADKIFTHRLFGIPIFAVIMALIFILTFSSSIFGLPMPGALLHSAVEGGIDVCLNALRSILAKIGTAYWLESLIIDGIMGGIGSVITFMPQILLLFFFITILESSGYMARAAFIMDGILRKVGLSGKSFVPMLMGFGCSVPAIMACRTIENEKDKALAITLIPFMSCGAKLPIYGLFSAAFFPAHQGAVMVLIYGIGVAVALMSALIIKKRLFKGNDAAFIMELPSYRMPTIRNISISLYEKMKHFLIKAGTIIALASAAAWLTQNVSFSLQMVDDPSCSMLGSIGKAMLIIFKPMGFGDNWQLPVAILAGIIAKEAVVSTLGVLYGAGEESAKAALAAPIASVLSSGILSPASGLAFMIFNLLAPPCSAALAVMRREMPSKKWFWSAMIFYIATAYTVSLLVYAIASVILNV
ncbi:MAG TPA: ferrous iron transport protein B [Firmicutes bacterium]|nr:ferrous iron transport protein B [Bacillota bacterium]